MVFALDKSYSEEEEEEEKKNEQYQGGVRAVHVARTPKERKRKKNGKKKGKKSTYVLQPQIHLLQMMMMLQGKRRG